MLTQVGGVLVPPFNFTGLLVQPLVRGPHVGDNKGIRSRTLSSSKNSLRTAVLDPFPYHTSFYVIFHHI